MQGIDCYRNIEKNDDLSGFVSVYGPLIKRIANNIKCKLPANIELDDLLQSGLVGLLEARNSFSIDGGASFETYASIKIRGSIIDQLRKNTGITRDISQNLKQISSVRSTMENTEDSENMISSKNIADKMGITEKKYSHIMSEINAFHSISINDVETIENIACTKSGNPFDSLEQEDIRLSVRTVIGSLPKREQQILALYYNEQLNFREIGDIMDLTEARISQIHLLSLAKIRKKYTYCYGMED